MENQKFYKIIPIKHLLKNNKIAKSGDVVFGSAFVNLQESLDNGFCKETDERPAGHETPAPAPAPTTTTPAPKLSEMKKDELILFAEENGIEVDSNDKKADILSTIEAALEA